MHNRSEIIQQRLLSVFENFEKDGKDGRGLEEELIRLRSYMSETVEKYLQVIDQRTQRFIPVKCHFLIIYQIFSDAES